MRQSASWTPPGAPLGSTGARTRLRHSSSGPSSRQATPQRASASGNSSVQLGFASGQPGLELSGTAQALAFHSPYSSFASSRAPRANADFFAAASGAEVPESGPQSAQMWNSWISNGASWNRDAEHEQSSIEFLESLQHPPYEPQAVREKAVLIPQLPRALGSKSDRDSWPVLGEGFEPLGPMLRSLEFQVGALFELMDAHSSREEADASVIEVIDRKRDSVVETFEAVKDALWWQDRRQ
ncbi:unnamed protein product, partial [Polarella glacialis]